MSCPRRGSYRPAARLHSGRFALADARDGGGFFGPLHAGIPGSGFWLRETCQGKCADLAAWRRLGLINKPVEGLSAGLVAKFDFSLLSRRRCHLHHHPHHLPLRNTRRGRMQEEPEHRRRP